MTATIVPIDKPTPGFGQSQAVRLILHTRCPVAGCISQRGTECNPPHPDERRKKTPFFHVARVARAFEVF